MFKLPVDWRSGRKAGERRLSWGCSVAVAFAGLRELPASARVIRGRPVQFFPRSPANSPRKDVVLPTGAKRSE